MPRASGSKRHHLREQIAYRAARLMAEGGVSDFALAKRKAARQTGISELRALPSNDEVEHALRAYQELYQAAEQRAVLLRLRRQALEIMRLLKCFNPHLTGSVLSGTAGRHSDVSLQLFVDSIKDVELFFLNNRIPYRRGEKRIYVGDSWRTIPVFAIEKDESEVKISVFSTNDLRHALRTSVDGKPIERAKTKLLENLLQEF